MVMKEWDELKKGHKSTKITRKSRRELIKETLGANFVAIRQLGDTIEVITKNDIPPEALARINKIWKNEEEKEVD